MIKGKSVLAIIPARGGSKGVPGKNIKNLAGKPLIAWTIEEAQKSKYIDRLILSSEDQKIIEVAKEYGCEVPFIRPAELARDETPGIAPVIHAISTISEKYDYVVLLQPTSPLRKVVDIDGCIEHCLQQKAPACVTICEAEHSPYWMYQMVNNFKICSLIPQESSYSKRQDVPQVYRLNGALYVAKISCLIEQKSFLSDMTIGYVMPRERSIDIDEPLDFQLCELLLTKKR